MAWAGSAPIPFGTVTGPAPAARLARMTPFTSISARYLADAWAVLAPTECSGCGAPDRALCSACAAELCPDPQRYERDGVTVWAGLEYAGAVRRLLGNLKDGGRTDAAPALVAPLRAVLAAALADSDLADSDLAASDAAASDPPASVGAASGPARAGVHLVTVPSTAAAWRARGYHPVELVLARAGLAPTRVLRLTGQTRDQVGLGRNARIQNKTGSLCARRNLTGLQCVIVDDILTTGATVLEARRAVTDAGGHVCAIATLAQTRRRVPVTHRSEKPR